MLCTIVKRAAPRPGALGPGCWCGPTGKSVGTVGGGAVEHQVTLDAQAPLGRDGAGPLRKHYDLSHAAAELGWCAGARSTWNLRCEDERDPAVYSEGLSPTASWRWPISRSFWPNGPSGGRSPCASWTSGRRRIMPTPFDYYYVPCYYVGGEKVHEGHAERADVEAVFRAALKENAQIGV